MESVGEIWSEEKKWDCGRQRDKWSGLKGVPVLQKWEKKSIFIEKLFDLKTKEWAGAASAKGLRQEQVWYIQREGENDHLCGCSIQRHWAKEFNNV